MIPKPVSLTATAVRESTSEVEFVETRIFAHSRRGLAPPVPPRRTRRFPNWLSSCTYAGHACRMQYLTLGITHKLARIFFNPYRGCFRTGLPHLQEVSM